MVQADQKYEDSLSSGQVFARTGLRFDAVDPGVDEAWWWAGIPLIMTVFLLTSHAISPAFYEAYILPEGYGFLEFGHFLIPAFTAILALVAARHIMPFNTVAGVLLVVFALGCIYIAGEEHSWGQHIFNWSTPEYWSEINRQQETNLHNMSSWFNHKPRTVLEVGMLLGALVVPLAMQHVLRLVPQRLHLFMPTLILLPAFAGYLLFKVKATLAKDFGITVAVTRPAEATETFMYLYLLFFILLVLRRIKASHPKVDRTLRT